MKKGIKRFLSLALALVMVIGMLPVTGVLAEGEPDTEYVDGREVTYVETQEELATALLVAQYIKLSSDINASSLDVGHPINDTTRDLVLDLNGHQIHITGVNGILNNYGTLLITDTSDEQTGAIDSEYETISNYNTLIFEGGKLSSGRACTTIINKVGSKLTLNGGAIETAGACVDVYGTATVNNGVSMTGANGIRVYGNGCLTVNGGQIISAATSANTSAVTMEGNAEVTIKGGTVTKTEGYGPVVILSDTSKLSIQGGEINHATNNWLVEGNGEVAITGGKFSTTVIEGIKSEGYIAEGYSIGDDGVVVKAPTVVTTVDALKSALAAGGEVWLGADIDCTGGGEFQVPANINTNLNLKGFALSFHVNDKIVNKGNLSVVDTSDGRTGKLVAFQNLFVNENGGVLTVKDVCITSDVPESAGGQASYYFDCKAGSETYITGVTMDKVACGVATGGYLILDGTAITAAHPLKVYNGANVTVKNAELTGNSQCMEICSNATVTVESGEFVARDGSCRIVEPDPWGAENIKLYIKGGIFDGEWFTHNTGCYETFLITGGQIIGDLIENEAKTDRQDSIHHYLAEGYIINEEGYVVEADTFVTVTTAEELSAAITNGGNIKLGEDISCKTKITVPAEVSSTLDLNGKTLTFNTGNGIENKGILKITDTSAEAAGKITSTYERIIENYGELTIDKGNYHSTNYRLITSYEGSEITLNGGVFECTGGTVLSSGGTTVINGATMSGIKTLIFDDTAEVTIVDADVTSTGEGYTNPAVTVSYDASVTIHDGEFKATGSNGFVIAGTADSAGKLTILGGSFEGKVPFDSYVNATWDVEIRGGTFTGNTMYFYSNGHNYTISGGEYNLSGTAAKIEVIKANVAISGGEFNVTDTDADFAAAGAGAVVITGGKFSRDIRFAARRYLAAGLGFDDDGSVTEVGPDAFITVNTADELADAIAGGGNIKLGADILLVGGLSGWNPSCTVTKDTVLDLNGKAANMSFYIKEDAKLTVLDSSEEKTGLLDTWSSVFFLDGGKLDIQGGNFKVKYDNVIDFRNAGSYGEINGGNFESGVANTSAGCALVIDDLTAAGGISCRGGEITVNGGTFRCTDASCVIYGSLGGKVTVNGGSFTNADSAIIRGEQEAIFEINGGDFTCPSGRLFYESGIYWSSYDATINGGSFRVHELLLGGYGEPYATINGGKFEVNEANPHTATITGGSFNRTAWANISAFLSGTGYELDSYGNVVKEGQTGAAVTPPVCGSEIVVTTEAELLAALAEGRYIKLGADIEAGSNITVSAWTNNVIDLNGKTLSGNSCSIDNYGILKITDTSAEGSGELTIYSVSNYGELTIDKGAYTTWNAHGFTNYPGSLFTINGGSVYAKLGLRGEAYLNGGTLAAGNPIEISKNADVTIGNVKATTSDRNSSVIFITDGAPNVTINGGSFNGYSVFSTSYLDGGSLTINGGSFEGSDPFSNGGLMDVEITGGTFTGNSVYFGGAGASYTISGGEFTLAQGMSIYDTSKVTVAGGKFNFTGTGMNARGVSVQNVADLDITGGVFKFTGTREMFSGYSTTINITGGEFAATDNTGGFNFNKEKATVVIAGGKFAPAAQVSAVNFLAEGYEFDAEGYVVKIGSESANAVARIGDVYYETLAEAIADVDAAEGSTTVTLLKDINLPSLQYVGYSHPQNITIDLGGHTVSSPGSTFDAFRAGTTLTLTNGTVTGNTTGGTLVANYGGKLILGDDLTVVGGPQALVIRVDNGHLVVNGENVRVEGGKTASITCSNGGSVTLSSGIYDHPVQLEWCAEGYAPREIGENKWEVAKSDPVAYLDTNNDGICDAGENLYNDLSDALADAAALSGKQTVVVFADTIQEAFIAVEEDDILDLNGHTVTGEYVAAFSGGHIVDNSVENKGLLVVAKDKIMMQVNNMQLPVYGAEGGYRFYANAKFNNTYLVEENKYCFQPFIEEAGHESIMAGGSGVNVIVRMSWSNEKSDGIRVQNFVYSAEHVESVLNSHYYNETTGQEAYRRMYTLTFGNIGNIKNLSCQAIVVSDTGVEIASDIIVLNKTTE